MASVAEGANGNGFYWIHDGIPSFCSCFCEMSLFKSVILLWCSKHKGQPWTVVFVYERREANSLLADFHCQFNRTLTLVLVTFHKATVVVTRDNTFTVLHFIYFIRKKRSALNCYRFQCTSILFWNVTLLQYIASVLTLHYNALQ